MGRSIRVIRHGNLSAVAVAVSKVMFALDEDWKLEDPPQSDLDTAKQSGLVPQTREWLTVKKAGRLMIAVW